MESIRPAIAAALSTLVLFLASCTVNLSPKITVEEERVLTIPIAEVTSIQVNTNNGSISSASAEESSGEIVVVATLKGGGDTEASASECLEAMEVTVITEDGTLKLGWQFSTAEKSDWQGSAAFAVTQPVELPFKGKTSNGRISAKNLTGNCNLISSNGRLTFDNCSGSLEGRTSNGRIEASGESGQVDFDTSNGRIILDSSFSGALSGRLRSSNGRVDVKLSSDTNTNIEATTGNGSLNISGDYRQVEITEDTLKARRGSKESSGRLVIETSNGSITIGDLD